jgi:hypothetical protein
MSHYVICSVQFLFYLFIFYIEKYRKISGIRTLKRIFPIYFTMFQKEKHLLKTTGNPIGNMWGNKTPKTK